MQDNDPEFGGGIDVVPGSHKLLFRTGINRLDGKIRLFKGKLGVFFNNKTVPIKKGDVVIFHSFLMHAATHPKGIFENITELDKKSAYYDQLRFLLGQRYPREFLEQVKKYEIQFARLEGPDLEEAKRICQLYNTL